MNLLPSEVTSLRAQLLEIDRIVGEIDALQQPIAQVESAIAKQRQRIADLAQGIASLAPAPVTADASRIDALLAGEDVTYADRKEIEANAAKSRLLSSRRDQMTVDLDALSHRLGALHMQVNGLVQQRLHVEHTFTVDLGDALHRAYRRDIAAFIHERIPQLLSVADRIATMTGASPKWHREVTQNPAVQWADESYAPIVPAGLPRMTVLWPRTGALLLSGEPISSPAIVDALIAELRAGGEQDKSGGKN